MNIDRNDVELYLSDVKEAINNDRYRLDRNTNRQDNIDLFLNYVILLSLTVKDFSSVVQNVHPGYEHERLYIFGKEVNLLERIGMEERLVPIYIKFNKLENSYVIVISFHEQHYPLVYCFR